MSTRAPYLSRAARRAERRRRRAEQPRRETSPIPEAIRRADPLLHPRSRWELVWVGALLVAAVGLHGAILGSFVGVNEVWAAIKGAPRVDEKIEVALIEPPPPPPAPEPEKPPEAPPEPAKKAESRPKAPPPPPDPIARPKPAEPPPAEPPKPSPRRVVGLSLESTVEGAGGPSFATGNTRMGNTERTAAAPAEVAPLPKDLPAEPPPAGPVNKAATRLPAPAAKLEEPERRRRVSPKYPEKYRVTGVEGDVVVRVSLDAEGKVTAVVIVQPGPAPEFDQAAREAALAEEFTPARKDGRPIPFSITYTYRFRLSDG